MVWYMSRQCEICGRFSGHVLEKTVRFRGVDRKAGNGKIKTDSRDVFIGECCGLDHIESGEVSRPARSYQRHLNGTGEGEVRFVLLVEESVPTEEIEIVNPEASGGGSMATVETSGVSERPVLGCELPESVKNYFIGNFG